MATLNTGLPTLLDVARRTDPNGNIADIVEIMSAVNPILEDAVFLEGNLPTGHKSTIRTGLPTPTWRKLYGGVQPTKSTTAQVTDSCGMLEDLAYCDEALANLNGNAASFRLSEDSAHIEGISQEIASSMFYANEATEPEAFTGFAPRFNSLSAQNADNIISASGAGDDNTSIWLVVWGPQTTFCIYPKGSKAGLQQTDMGIELVDAPDSSGKYRAYRTHYRQDVGLVVRDWRYVVRIANIDVSDLGTVANTKNLITWMIKASERIPVLGRGRAAWYVNRGIRENLRLGILEKVSSNLSWETVEGKRVMMFDGIPVRRCDAITNSEAVVA